MQRRRAEERMNELLLSHKSADLIKKEDFQLPNGAVYRGEKHFKSNRAMEWKFKRRLWYSNMARWR
jgi:hypothetical protein